MKTICIAAFLALAAAAAGAEPWELRLTVPSNGSSVVTTVPLVEGAPYVVIVTGTFLYNADVERGRNADACHDEWEDGTWHRNYYLAIDGHTWVPDGRDLKTHTYRYSITGEGKPLSLKIADTRYDDNEGTLSARIRRR